ncbi:MAG: hypothetical protein LW698_01910 [Planctomycetaceae bacterium]|nr:hypothetical protein [Planctomycetaceae bacterium]
MPTSSRRRQSSLAIGNGRRASSRCTVLGHESLERRACPAAFSLELPSTPIVEGDRATFTVRMAAPSTLPQRVAVSAISGSATLGNDFIFSNATQLLFSPGQTVKTFSVQTFTDSISERSETFRITATPLNVPNAATISAQATIYDLVATTVTAGDVRVTEGNAGTVNATFTVTLGGQPILPVTVLYSTRDVTATAGSDYAATSGSVVFRPGETTKTFTVSVSGDTIAEFDETYQVLLSSPTRGCTVTTPTLTGTIVNDEQDTPGFQITIRFDDVAGGPVPAAVRTATIQAANRWSRVITGDVPGVTVGPLFIDDFEMVVQMGLLGGAPEGPGGVLANARPTAFRGTGLPYSGITGIDPNDITMNPGALQDTLTHEIGHALGFTPGATVFSQWIVGDTFTGANAVREFNSLFGRTGTSVPLQPEIRAHWDEGVFGNELMSPSTALNGDFISRVTIGALADMGYTVNYAAAEAYVPPLIVVVPPPLIPALALPTTPRSGALPRPLLPPVTPAPLPTIPPTSARPPAGDRSTPVARRTSTSPVARPPAAVSPRTSGFRALGS